MAGGSTQGLSVILAKVFTQLIDKIVVGPFSDYILKAGSKGSNLITKFFSSAFGKGGFVRYILGKLFGKKGLMLTKAIGKGGAGFLKTAFKGLGKTFLKRIPIIGSIFSFGSALKRMKDGDVMGGLIDIGSGLANLSNIIAPGAGLALSIALDVLNAKMDIDEGRGKTGGLVGLKKKFNDWFAKNSRNLPLLGTVVRLAEAFGYLTAGGDDNIKNFLLSLGGAVYSLSLIHI